MTISMANETKTVFQRKNLNSNLEENHAPLDPKKYSPLAKTLVSFSNNS